MSATSWRKKWWSRIATGTALAVIVAFLVGLGFWTYFLGNPLLLVAYLLTPILVIVAYRLRDGFSPWLEDSLELLGEQMPLIRVAEARRKRREHNREVAAAMAQTLDLYGLGSEDKVADIEKLRYLTPGRLAGKTAENVGVNPDALELLYREDHDLPTRTLFESSHSTARDQLPGLLCRRLEPLLAPMPVDENVVKPFLEKMRDFDIGLLIAELREIGTLWAHSRRYDSFRAAEGLDHIAPATPGKIVTFASKHRRLPERPRTLFRLNDGDLAYQWLLERGGQKDQAQNLFALGCYLVCAGPDVGALLERTCREAATDDHVDAVARAVVARNGNTLETLFSHWPAPAANKDAVETDKDAVESATASMRMGIWPDPNADAYRRQQDAVLRKVVEQYEAGDSNRSLQEIKDLLAERGEQPVSDSAELLARAKEIVDESLRRRLDDAQDIAAAVVAKSGTSDLVAATQTITERVIALEAHSRELADTIDRFEQAMRAELGASAREDSLATLRTALETLRLRIGTPAQRGAVARLHAALDAIRGQLGGLDTAVAGAQSGISDAESRITDALHASLADVYDALDRMESHSEPRLDAYLITFDEYSGPVADLLDCLAAPLTQDQGTFLLDDLEVQPPARYCFGKYTRYTRLGIVPPESELTFEEWYELFRKDLEKVFVRRLDVLAAAGIHMVAVDEPTRLVLEGDAAKIDITAKPEHGQLSDEATGRPPTVIYTPPDAAMTPPSEMGSESPTGARVTRDRFEYTHAGKPETVTLALRRDFSKIEVTVERIDLRHSRELHFEDETIEGKLRERLSICDVWDAVEGKLEPESRAELKRLIGEIAGGPEECWPADAAAEAEVAETAVAAEAAEAA